MSPGTLRERDDLPEALLDADYMVTFKAESAWSLEDLRERYIELTDFMGPSLHAATHTRGWHWHRYMFEDGYQIDSDWTALWSFLDSLRIYNAPYTSTRDLPFTLDPGAEDMRISRTYNGEAHFSETFSTWRLCPGSSWRNDYPQRLSQLMNLQGVTDLYLDNYPVPFLCFDAGHEHPRGGGTWFLDGYLSMFEQIRENAPQATLANESRCEDIIPWMNIFPNHPWGRAATDGWFALKEGEPIPLVSAVYNDRVTLSGSVGYAYAALDSTTWRFMQAWAWVNGQRIGVVLENEPLDLWSSGKLATFEMTRDMLRLTARSPDPFFYGRWERPPAMTGFETIGIHFPENGGIHEYHESPAVIGGTLIGSDGRPALLLANFTAAPQSGSVEADFAEMGLAPASWDVWKLRASGEVDSLGAFSGGLFQRAMNFDPLEACVLLFTEPGGSTDLPESAGASAWKLAAWPNPSSGSCSLILEGLPSGAAPGRTRIYDLRGRLVRDLGFGETWLWDGRNTRGQDVVSGIYFARTDLRGLGGRTRKLLVVR